MVVRTLDRAPLLRFSSPSALACHVALAGRCHSFPAVPLRLLGSRPPSPSPGAVWHLSPTHRRRLLALAAFGVCALGGAGSVGFVRGSKPRMLAETLRRS